MWCHLLHVFSIDIIFLIIIMILFVLNFTFIITKKIITGYKNQQMYIFWLNKFKNSLK